MSSGISSRFIIAGVIIPLPEQKRISAKVGELMALCDQLEQKNQELLDVVDKLQATILQLAVEGKLVPQDSNDEPASELIKKINIEKERLIKEGKIKRSKPLPPITDDEKPFEIPESWEWVRLPESYRPISAARSKIQTSEIIQTGKYPVIDQGQHYIAGYTNHEPIIKISRSVVIFGDHTKSVKLIDFDFVVGADGVKILQPYLHCRYFYYFMQQLPLNDRGYSRHYSQLSKKIIPIPPAEEQERIAAKVDEFMQLCNQLETRIALATS